MTDICGILEHQFDRSACKVEKFIVDAIAGVSPIKNGTKHLDVKEIQGSKVKTCKVSSSKLGSVIKEARVLETISVECDRVLSLLSKELQTTRANHAYEQRRNTIDHVYDISKTVKDKTYLTNEVSSTNNDDVTIDKSSYSDTSVISINNVYLSRKEKLKQMISMMKSQEKQLLEIELNNQKMIKEGTLSYLTVGKTK